jgi:hypothetical protein
MPRLVTEPVDLAGLVLDDVRGAPVDLGALPGPAALVVIRHRY